MSARTTGPRESVRKAPGEAPKGSKAGESGTRNRRPGGSEGEVGPSGKRPGGKKAPKEKRSSDKRSRLIEVVFFFLYDVGQRADLKKVAALIPAHDDMGIVKRRDTPASLLLPRPLVVKLNETEVVEANDFESFTSLAKIYEDGAVTVIIRVKARIPFEELHTLRGRTVLEGGRGLTLDEYAEESFRRIFEAIKPAVSGPWAGDDFTRETYTAYCLIDGHEDPYGFLEAHRATAASLLIGESPSEVLHESQVGATLGRPFSYRKDDLAVFDMDRCLIIDRRRDYEDLLLIVEHANYQLLELRVLDKLLDRWLDEAERDMRLIYSGDARKEYRISGSAQQKFAHIQTLRFDALFILENLENSSKIIGDYYLGQIYDRLCSIFNTNGWKWSVERRLDTLQSVYDMVKTDSSDKKMLMLETVFIVVCIVFPLIQILQVMLK